jgi:hypothetical protein
MNYISTKYNLIIEGGYNCTLTKVLDADYNMAGFNVS